MMKSILLASILALAAVADAHICSEHTYLGNNPDEGNPGWHAEVQGLAHDADYWYITQNPAFSSLPPASPFAGGPRLWRIPVTHDLGAGVGCGSGDVSCGDLLDTPLLAHDYNHYGDPDFYEFGGRAYILVPIENGDEGPGVAIFRADATLEFLAFAPFPEQTHSGWVAVDPSGLLLSSNSGTVPQFNRFYLDWTLFQASGEHDFVLQPRPPILLQDESGSPLTLVGRAQGGEFSDDGQLLYFSGDVGVHVFETRAGSGAECGATGDPCTIARRIERSHNGPGGFAFEFDTGNLEEPEGLTFWDLDADGRAPGLRGQLHVVLLDNDVVSGDDAYVKHYRLSLEDTVAPVIACPADVVAECSVHTGVPLLDPQLSSFFSSASAVDTCDEHPTITNDAPPLFGVGMTSVGFTATDASSNAATCSARVTVVDTLPPVLACPPPITVECTGPAGTAAADPQLAPFFAGVIAADACDASPVVSNDAPASFPQGLTTVTFTSHDATGNSAQACQSSVRVADTMAPQISVTLNAGTLWPPDHRLVAITAAATGTDRCDPAVSLELVSIASNEPDNGLGDGDFPGDIQGAAFGTADTTFLLRAERSGGGAGRIYTIVYRATDSAGNMSTAKAYVVVPHSR